MTGWLRAHKLLLVVYGSSLVLAAIELTHPSLRPGQPDDPSFFLDPDANIVSVSEAVYPGRAASLYYRAFQASLCDGAARGEEVCRERGPVRPGEIRELLARSLATGNRSMELAMYNYALVLVQEHADAAEIEAAIRTWRASYPGSARPDPREAYQQMRQARAGPAR